MRRLDRSRAAASAVALVVLAWLVVLASIAGPGSTVAAAGTGPADAVAQAVPASTPPSAERLTGVAGKRCFGAASRDSRKPCVNRTLSRVVEPTPDDAVTEPSEPCTPVRGSALDACTFGVDAADARGTIALIGDSHATHWRAALNVVAKDQRLQGISVTRSGCAFTLAQTRGAGRCGGWAKKVLRWLGTRPDITGVVTSASTGTRVVAADGLTPRGTAIAGFRDIWAAIPRSVRDVWVVRDVPHLAWDATACVDQAILARAAPSGCGRPRLEALPTDFSAVAYRLGAPVRVHLLDLTSFMCDDARCLAVVGGALVSKDGGHLTRTFSRSMGPYLGRAMASTQLPVPRGTTTALPRGGAGAPSPAPAP